MTEITWFEWMQRMSKDSTKMWRELYGLRSQIELLRRNLDWLFSWEFLKDHEDEIVTLLEDAGGSMRWSELWAKIMDYRNVRGPYVSFVDRGAAEGVLESWWNKRRFGYTLPFELVSVGTGHRIRLKEDHKSRN
jgi:hypothetical protein